MKKVTFALPDEVYADILAAFNYHRTLSDGETLESVASAGVVSVLAERIADYKRLAQRDLALQQAAAQAAVDAGVGVTVEHVPDPTPAPVPDPTPVSEPVSPTEQPTT